MACRARVHIPFVIQLTATLIATVFVIYRLMHFREWDLFIDKLIINKWSLVLLILLQSGLTVLNLSIEAMKWRILTSVLQPLKFNESLKQVIRGIQVGMLTPARAGEPVAKAMLFRKGNRVRAFLLSAAGSMVQNLVIAVAGVLSAIIAARHGLLANILNCQVHDTIFRQVLFIIPAGFIFIFAVFLLLRYPGLNAVFKRLRLHLHVLKKLDIGLISKLFAVTLARYLVFTLQLWLVLDFFAIVELSVQYWLIPVYYTLVTIVPTIALADLGIRGSVALVVFGAAPTNTGAIIASVFIIWLFNLAIPSIAGILFLRGKK